MHSCKRVYIHPPAVIHGERPGVFAAGKAAWIWLDDAPPDKPVAARFTNRFHLDEPVRVVVHVSADQRYRLSLDGEVISRGPHRGDLAHWAFLSYELSLSAGEHVLEADVVWMGDYAPCAQLTWRPGFLFAAEGPLESILDTGKGEGGEQGGKEGGGWSVRHLPGYAYTSIAWTYIGGQLIYDGRPLPGLPTKPVVIRKPQPSDFRFGQRLPGWYLWPSPLPDMLDEPISGGRVRAVIPGGLDDKQPVTAEMTTHPDIARWQAMLNRPGDAPVSVPAGSTVSVIVDWEEYHLVHSSITLDGEVGSEASVTWAEAFAYPQGHPKARFKGHRSELLDKRNNGLLRDHFIHSPDPDHPGPRRYETEMWRSGRYTVLTVRAPSEGDATVVAMTPRATRYPLTLRAEFSAPSAAVMEPIPLMTRGLQCCSHETFFDCPHYEQLQYVGDTRITMLLTYALSNDDRLARRALDLFMWSRAQFEHGMSAERYPSRTPQESTTYGLLWPCCLRDFAWWRDDKTWVQARLPAMRSTLEGGLALLANDGLLGPVPGWSFVDWVPGWRHGVPPNGDMSSLVNLHLLLSLQAGADLEDAVGDANLAHRWRNKAAQLAARIEKNFWNETRGLVADDRAQSTFSEHAQCLMLLSGMLLAEKADRAWNGLLTATDLAPTTVYFSYYLFETFAARGRGDLILDRLHFWQDMARNGFKTPMEHPEPSRSDCHAWSSHPLFHYYASLAGIRPAAPGFSRMRIAPAPGALPWMKARMPHPRGTVEVDLTFAPGDAGQGVIRLPEGVDGEYVFGGITKPLKGGENQIGK
ncbi:MAG: hypothetical protein FWD61_06550 [Phycisphaerales bacterium]|nr:hypothetical protein [Phycisphaerales bacterium]